MRNSVREARLTREEDGGKQFSTCRSWSIHLKIARVALMTEAGRREKIKAVIRVSSGNFLEMYDFMVFGYYAAAIGKTFFPKDNEFASLMLSLATFGVGFLMRPIGAVVLGAYIDRHGRRAGLILTLALMS